MSTGRYLGLDALRGILALAVGMHHFGLSSGVAVMKSAWLAVDVFFVLSGFVIYISYRSRIKEGLGYWPFMYARFLRLYPVYAIGFLLGVLSYFIEVEGFKNLTAGLLLRSLAGIFIVPVPLEYVSEGWVSDSVFLFNPPSWSLFFELFVNIIFFIFIKFNLDAQRHFYWLTPLVFLLFLLSLWIFGLSNGYSVSNFWGGFLRVILFFMIGCGISTLINKKWKLGLGFMALVTLLYIVCFNFGNRYLLISLLLIGSPLLVYVIAHVQISSKNATSLFCWLGAISYPFYITHFPIYKIYLSLAGNAFANPWIDIFIGCLFSILISSLLATKELAIRNCFSRVLSHVWLKR